MGAWFPSEPFQQGVLQELSGFWTQPLLDLRGAVLKLGRAAALYRPIQKSLRSVADRGGWGDFWHDYARPTLTVLAAIKTSEVAINSSQAALTTESDLSSRILQGWQTQLTNILFFDYSQVPLNQQQNFVVGLLSSVGLDATGIDALRPRGILAPEPVAAPEAGRLGHLEHRLVWVAGTILVVLGILGLILLVWLNWT